jgi:septum formation protein
VALILASRSPQRQALLKALGLKFRAVSSEVAEGTEGDPRELVLVNALAKARAVARRRRAGTTVIAGDTEVVIDGRALGQPESEGEARWCLETLSGKTHQVLGALAVLGPERQGSGFRERTGVEVSRVTFTGLERELIEAYLVSGEWRGRAGGYAVQGLGSALVSRVEGDLSNVIGLPVGLLARLAPELISQGR